MPVCGNCGVEVFQIQRAALRAFEGTSLWTWNHGRLNDDPSNHYLYCDWPSGKAVQEFGVIRFPDHEVRRDRVADPEDSQVVL